MGTGVEDALGLGLIFDMHKDAQIILICKSLRMFTFGFSGVIFVIFLQQLNLTASEIGLVLTYSMLGDFFIGIAISSKADLFGRKKFLSFSSMLSMFTMLIFISRPKTWVLMISAWFGMISTSGGEIAAFNALELSAITQVTPSAQMTGIIAWYLLIASLSVAIGGLTCGAAIDYLCNTKNYSLLESHISVMTAYVVIHGFQTFLYSLLSVDVEVPKSTPKNNQAITMILGLHKSKWVVLKLSLLFVLESFASSFVSQSFISAWLFSRFNTSATTIGMVFFICHIISGVSHLFVAKIAKHFGLLMTLVFTQILANAFTTLVPLMKNEPNAITMLFLRYCIAGVASPARTAYIQQVVASDERSAANGLTNVVRPLGKSMGPFLAEILYSKPKYSNYPFFIAGSIKLIYDLLLLLNFHSLKPLSELSSQEQKIKDGEKLPLLHTYSPTQN